MYKRESKNNPEDFDEVLERYKKKHPGDYCSYPCPKCGAPVWIMYGPGVSHEECTNPKCDYHFDDVSSMDDFDDIY